ncbi:hypothetical protein N9L68_02370 [bacterium]|nr:hypothetical protein [bacterium]
MMPVTGRPRVASPSPPFAQLEHRARQRPPTPRGWRSPKEGAQVAPLQRRALARHATRQGSRGWPRSAVARRRQRAYLHNSGRRST